MKKKNNFNNLYSKKLKKCPKMELSKKNLNPIIPPLMMKKKKNKNNSKNNKNKKNRTNK